MLFIMMKSTGQNQTNTTQIGKSKYNNYNNCAYGEAAGLDTCFLSSYDVVRITTCESVSSPFNLS